MGAGWGWLCHVSGPCLGWGTAGTACTPWERLVQLLPVVNLPSTLETKDQDLSLTMYMFIFRLYLIGQKKTYIQLDTKFLSNLICVFYLFWCTPLLVQVVYIRGKSVSGVCHRWYRWCISVTPSAKYIIYNLKKVPKYCSLKLDDWMKILTIFPFLWFYSITVYL